VLVLWRERDHRASAAFALGMGCLAARELFGVYAGQAVFESEALPWHRYRLLAVAAAPGFWLWFSLVYARAKDSRFHRGWRRALLLAFVLPPALALLGWESLVSRASYPTPRWLVPVGGGGYWLHVMFLLAAVAILMNLENTLRASSGSVRWQIKFTVLGVGALFGVEVFLYSQVLLYSSIQTTLLPIGSAALLLAGALVALSLARRGLGSFDVYPSESLLFNSLTLLLVGVYLLAVAGLVEVIGAFGGAQRAPVIAFVVLVAMVALALILLSTELRQKAKEFLNRHLKRPTHDYRRIWDAFTRRTSAVVEVEPLAAAITKITAETFGCAAATIWLVRQGENKIQLGGSSAVSTGRAASILMEHDQGRALHALLASRAGKVVDLSEASLAPAVRGLAHAVGARYGVALSGSDGSLVGFLTVDDRVTGQKYSLEDFALLQTLADQAAATISNRQLARELQRAKEMETFQTLSAFFIHDLKNLASRLSLVMQNLPQHYDKPAFRDDLLRTMAKSVEKIDSMTARLSSLGKGLSLQLVESDVNDLVRETLEGLNGTMKANLSLDFQEVPRVALDPEQIQKVVTNLILNAHEASSEGGQVVVSTARENGWVLLSVSDDGCGMSEDFLSGSLFKPFQTTKKQGLGIGLYHSKTIVEAHGGRIEVESALGKGTTFRVLLPSAGHSSQRGK
jgi:putative PEP-CTERM system histidine kinase